MTTWEDAHFESVFTGRALSSVESPEGASPEVAKILGDSALNKLSPSMGRRRSKSGSPVTSRPLSPISPLVPYKRDGLSPTPPGAFPETLQHGSPKRKSQSPTPPGTFPDVASWKPVVAPLPTTVVAAEWTRRTVPPPPRTARLAPLAPPSSIEPPPTAPAGAHRETPRRRGCSTDSLDLLSRISTARQEAHCGSLSARSSRMHGGSLFQSAPKSKTID